MKRVFLASLTLALSAALLSPAAFADALTTEPQTKQESQKSESVNLENGQVLYSKYADTASAIKVENKSNDGCLIIVYKEYRDLFDNSTDGEIVMKFYVDGCSNAEIACPSGTYCVRAVFGENYIPRKDSLEDYRMTTGRFEKETADYIAGCNLVFSEGNTLEVAVSVEDADSFTGTIPYLYYISKNHAWTEAYLNEKTGRELKLQNYRIEGTGWNFSYWGYSDYSDGYFEPY